MKILTFSLVLLSACYLLYVYGICFVTHKIPKRTQLAEREELFLEVESKSGVVKMSSLCVVDKSSEFWFDYDSPLKIICHPIGEKGVTRIQLSADRKRSLFVLSAQSISREKYPSLVKIKGETNCIIDSRLPTTLVLQLRYHTVVAIPSYNDNNILWSVSMLKGHFTHNTILELFGNNPAKLNEYLNKEFLVVTQVDCTFPEGEDCATK